MTDPLTEAAERLFTAQVTKPVLQQASEGVFPQALWDAVTEAGFTAALLPEQSGGPGTTMSEAMRLLQISAAHAAPIPLAETMLASWLLAQAGLPIPQGPLTLAPVRRTETLTLHPEGNDYRISGTATRIPWARNATALVLLTEGPHLALIPAPQVTITHSDQNLAAEPRDTITLDALLPPTAVAPSPLTRADLRAAGAALRTIQIAGALSRALSLTVDYAQTRIQFGRPIAKFQAIQHNLALLAGQSAAALAAAGLATEALSSGLNPVLIAAAKSRAGEAATQAAALSHQIHGAIGFTRDYPLHHLTSRLWSWRDEFGNESEWNAQLGRTTLTAGPEALWPTLTAA